MNSEPAQQFIKSMIFWSDKRPITVEKLKRLDLHALSIELGCEEEYLKFARCRIDRECEDVQGQLSLGIAEKTAKYSTNQNKASNKSLQRTRHMI